MPGSLAIVAGLPVLLSAHATAALTAGERRRAVVANWQHCPRDGIPSPSAHEA